MSFKSKLLASAATLTLVGGAGVGALATAGAANAATPSCGPICINIFSFDFPVNANGTPSFVIDTYKRGQNVGQPIILFRSSGQDPAEDFTYGEQGLVSDFFAAGLVSASLNLHYGGGAHFPGTSARACAPFAFDPKAGACLYPDLNAFELEYAPYGADTGLCMGVAATAVQGEKVSLQPCGVSSKTVWVEDALDGLATHGGGIPLINGSDTNFSHPFVLTYPSGSYPTDNPRPQLFVSNLTGSSQGPGGILPVLGTVSDAQLWAYFPGVLSS